MSQTVCESIESVSDQHAIPPFAKCAKDGAPRFVANQKIHTCAVVLNRSSRLLAVHSDSISTVPTNPVA